MSATVKLGQALRGNLWAAKSNIARILKKPFKQSMSMANIKAGFCKCGIYPFNPNAIDKSQLSRNKLIPDEDVDLSIPPEETSDYAIEAENTTDDAEIDVQVEVPHEQNLLDDLPTCCHKPSSREWQRCINYHPT